MQLQTISIMKPIRKINLGIWNIRGLKTQKFNKTTSNEKCVISFIVLTVKRCLAEKYSVDNLPKKIQFYKDFLAVTKKLDVGYPIVSNFGGFLHSIYITN